MSVDGLAMPAGVPGRTPIHRVIIAASVGNALEWFDFVVYGYFAVDIAKVFFPAGNETVSLLATLATFGLAYLVRPLGAIVLGAYADRAGRKAALTLSIGLMMTGTTVMAVIPSYAMIGVAAPVLVLLARLLQGFSVGGEFGSSTAFLVEHSKTRKGFMAAWQWASQGMSGLLASIFGVVLTSSLSQDQLVSWGWRLPFLFGLLIGPIGLYIRSRMAETPEFAAAEPAKAPVRSLIAQHPAAVLMAIGASVISNSSNYLILYIPTYAIHELHLPQSTGYIATLIGAVILGSVSLVAGHWSDKIGRTRIMFVMTVLFFLTSYPIFAAMVAYPSLATAVLAAGWLSLVKAGYSGVLPSLLSELFPIDARAIGMSFSYSVSVTIFGGFAPFFATWLIAHTGDKLSPSYYLMATSALSMIAIAAAGRRATRAVVR